MANSEGLKTSVEDITGNQVERAREAEPKWSQRMGLKCYDLMIRLERGDASQGGAMKVVSGDGLSS